MHPAEAKRGTITVEEAAGGLHVVCLRGAHDFVTASELEDILRKALAAASGIVLDLSETTFLDSAVLHAIVSPAKLGQLGKREIVLQFGSYDPIQRIFEITRLLDLFTTASTRQEAIALAGGGLQVTAPNSSTLPS
jgi:anti-anti-sigma factor